MLQNATPLRKWAPGPANISDEHVSCTAPAAENASLQILFKCPTPAIVFGNATKPSRFDHFWQGAQSLAPETTSEHPKVLRTRQFYVHFWLGNVLRATTAWTFSTCQLPKVQMVCFVDFDLDMCFAPQWRALFRHVNFQKCSDVGVLCKFWLGNVLRATTACTFSTSQLPKVLRRWCALYVLTWKCASRHNGVHFFIISTSKSGLNVFFWLRNLIRATTACNFHLSSSQMAPRPPL